MGKISPTKLRSFNGRLGYIRKQRGGGYKFVDIDGKLVLNDLRKWEIEAALKPLSPGRKKWAAQRMK
jgi:hypothetical protein